MGNKLNLELEGKYVILDKKYFSGETDVERMFLCSNGFGCSPECNGHAIFGHFTIDGEECRIAGHQVKRLATPEEIAQANYPQPMTKRQKLERQQRLLAEEKEKLDKRIVEIEQQLRAMENKVD